MSDEALVQECRSGRKEAFGELYDRYIKKIYTFVYYKTHHKETAEDLTSKTFFKALENINTCDPNQPFAAWVYRIARNTVIDHYRTFHPAVPIEDAWDLPDGSHALQDLDTKRSLAAVKKFVKALPPIQREILTLRLWEGLSYKEIAEIVDKKESNCKVIFSRAIGELRAAVPYALILLFLIRT